MNPKIARLRQTLTINNIVNVTCNHGSVRLCRKYSIVTTKHLKNGKLHRYLAFTHSILGKHDVPVKIDSEDTEYIAKTLDHHIHIITVSLDLTMPLCTK